MKHEKIFKDFSALSFEAGRVEAAIADSPPRLTPDSVRDFNVQHDSAANGDWPENDGLATTRRWQQRVLLLLSNDPGFQVAVRQALPQQIELMPVRHAAQVVQLAHKSFINAALLDLDLDDCESWRTAEQLLADNPSVRLLLAVETNGRLDLIGGVKAGDVLEKPVNAAPVAVDGSPDSELVVRAILERAWPPLAEFQLVTVIDSRLSTLAALPTHWELEWTQRHGADAGQWVCRAVDHLASVLREAGLTVETHILNGDPKQTLLKHANDRDADCIFLGAHGLDHGEQRALGTLASVIATRAPCSIEIIRPKPPQP